MAIGISMDNQWSLTNNAFEGAHNDDERYSISQVSTNQEIQNLHTGRVEPGIDKEHVSRHGLPRWTQKKNGSSCNFR